MCTCFGQCAKNISHFCGVLSYNAKCNQQYVFYHHLLKPSRAIIIISRERYCLLMFHPLKPAGTMFFTFSMTHPSSKKVSFVNDPLIPTTLLIKLHTSSHYKMLHPGRGDKHFLPKKNLKHHSSLFPLDSQKKTRSFYIIIKPSKKTLQPST